MCNKARIQGIYSTLTLKESHLFSSCSFVRQCVSYLAKVFIEYLALPGYLLICTVKSILERRLVPKLYLNMALLRPTGDGMSSPPPGLLQLCSDNRPTHYSRTSLTIDKKNFSSYVLTKGTVEHAIHEWEERLKQRRFHEMWIVEGICHSRTDTMRRVCFRVNGSVWICKRQVFD